MRTRNLLVPAVLALWAAGCGEAATGPVPVAWGEDACDVCRMIVSEPPFAAQARFAPAAVERYDDLGCLAERLAGGARAVEIWVTDRRTGSWIDGRTAVFVQIKDLKTPMASGLAAFGSLPDARKTGGTILSLAHLETLGRPK